MDTVASALDRAGKHDEGGVGGREFYTLPGCLLQFPRCLSHMANVRRSNRTFGKPVYVPQRSAKVLGKGFLFLSHIAPYIHYKIWRGGGGEARSQQTVPFPPHVAKVRPARNEHPVA